MSTDLITLSLLAFPGFLSTELTPQVKNSLMMAIIEELGLQATIVINDEAAPEYPDTEPSVSEELGPDTKKSHNYVRSVAGAEFAIKFDLTSPSSQVTQWLAKENHAIAVLVLIDGGKLNAGTLIDRQRQSGTISGVTDAANGLHQKFCFTAISTGMSRTSFGT